MAYSIKMSDPAVTDSDGSVWNLYAIDYQDEQGEMFSLDLYAKSWAHALHHLEMIKKSGDIVQIVGREA